MFHQIDCKNFAISLNHKHIWRSHTSLEYVEYHRKHVNYIYQNELFYLPIFADIFLNHQINAPNMKSWKQWVACSTLCGSNKYKFNDVVRDFVLHCNAPMHYTGNQSRGLVRNANIYCITSSSSNIFWRQLSFPSM